MDAIEFVQNYSALIESITPVLRVDAVEFLRSLKAHDLVTPEAYFSGRTHAIGYLVHIALQNGK